MVNSLVSAPEVNHRAGNPLDSTPLQRRLAFALTPRFSAVGRVSAEGKPAVSTASRCQPSPRPMKPLKRFLSSSLAARAHPAEAESIQKRNHRWTQIDTDAEVPMLFGDSRRAHHLVRMHLTPRTRFLPSYLCSSVFICGFPPE